MSESAARALTDLVTPVVLRVAATIGLLDRAAEEPGVRYKGGSDEHVLAPVVQILTAGQRAGQFRAFDVRVVAATIQRSIETLPLTLQTEPGLDVDAYGRELVTVFELGVRKSDEHASSREAKAGRAKQ